MTKKFSELKELKEFTAVQLARLKKEYEPMRGKTISMPNAKKLGAMLDRLTKDMLIKLANADIPFVSMSAASKLAMKHGMKFTDFKNLRMEEADELQQEACWTGYKQVGLKKKGNRMVPNCVPESVVREMFGDMINEINDLRGSFTDAQLERMKQDWKNKPASALTQGVKQMIMRMDAPTRAALENAKINHISKFAGSTFKESVDPSCPRCEGEACECPQGEQPVQEADLSKSQIKMVHKTADKMPKKDFIKRYGKDGDSVRFATATNMVKKKLGIEEEDFVPQQSKGENMNEMKYKDKFKAAMKDFGINSLDDLKTDADKKKFFKKVDSMHTAKNEELTPAQKKLPAGLQKAIMKKQKNENVNIDKDEMMSSEMMKKEMMKKMEMMKAEMDPEKMEMMKKEMMKEMEKMPEMMKKEMMKKMEMMKQDEMMKKEMAKKMEMLKAEKDPMKMEMMKKEMMSKMNAMKMPEMMKKEMMKKMEMAMKEGFASDAQRRAAFASGYKEKGKKKDEMKKMNAMKMKEAEVPAEPMKKLNTGEKMKEEAEPMTRDTMSLADKDPINAMKMNAMRMPIRKNEMMRSEMKMEMMKKEMMKKMEMMKAETDPEKMEMMKSEMMKEMEKMPEMMKSEMMKKMEMAMKEYGNMMAMKDMNAMKKMNALHDPRTAMKQDDNMKPMASMKMNAMKLSEPMKKMDSKGTEGGAKTDADMSKVKDKQKPLMAMMKKEKYMPLKPGSIQETVALMQMREQELVEVKGDDLEKMISDYLKKGGTIKKLPPALAKGMKPSEMKPHSVGAKGVIKSMKMGEVRDFVSTYNSHFLTNHRAEELLER